MYHSETREFVIIDGLDNIVATVHAPVDGTSPVAQVELVNKIVKPSKEDEFTEAINTLARSDRERLAYALQVLDGYL